ncbi:MAG: superoxide dismutase family protein [Burkholderiaceae bacterium]
MRRLAMVAMMATAIAVGGCSTFEAQGPRAMAKFDAAPGSEVWGSVSFVETATGVQVLADVRNLPAGGEFGFHVHEKGDCSSPDFMSAGGHFNPGGKPHAHFGKPERHAGDLANLRATAEGNATYAFETKLLTVKPGPTSVVGRAVVIHRNPDDYASQPAGNSGPRIACGLIREVDQGSEALYPRLSR